MIKKISMYVIVVTSLLSIFEVNAGNSDLNSTHIKLSKIICIGDSITQGGTIGRPEYSYRLPLQRLISSQKYQVDFIGARQLGLHENFTWPRGFDPDHEGFYGQTSEYISSALMVDLTKIDSPDIAIIHVGSNDRDSLSREKIIKPTVDMIKQLRVKNPNIKILIIQIPGRFKYLFTRIWVWWLSKSLSSNQSPIQTLDLHPSWHVGEHTFDGAHPNIVGQQLMADMIFSKLKPFLD